MWANDYMQRVLRDTNGFCRSRLVGNLSQGIRTSPVELPVHL